MKKLISEIMALTILTSSISATSVFAEETDRKSECTGYTVTDIDVTVGADVDGTIDPNLQGEIPEDIEDSIVDITGKESEAKIYVEVEWDELKFTYDFGTVKEYEWDLKKLDYVPVYEYNNGECAGWDKESAEIRFKNFSNRDVYAGVSFEKNAAVDVYEDVDVTFDKEYDLLLSAVGRDEETLDEKVFTMSVSGKPDDSIDKENVPALGSLKFYISEEIRVNSPEQQEESEEGEELGHEHHFVYDQFGRLVCTGCHEVKHEYCIDEDEDGICDECGMERDFCPDCHVGGKCVCT